MIESYLLKNIAGYIDGQWIAQADSGKTTEVFNPANGKTLAETPYMGTDETRRAIAAAKAARDTVPDVATRRGWLEDCYEALTAEKEEIGRILCLEHGKPWAEAQGEVDYAASFFSYFAGMMEDTLAPETLLEQAKDCRWTVHKRPIGVAGLITPWNFPIGMIAKKVAPALAAGCPLVIKPAAETPLTMIAMFQLLHERLDLPKGMINLVMGSSKEIGGEIMSSFDVPMISFTGSTEVGQLLVEQSSQHVKKLGLELGGNAPFIVLDDADLESAADNLIANKFRGAGQTCVCANRIFVQDGVYDEFVNKVVERVKKLKVGDGMDENTDVGPLINAAGFDKVHDHVKDALSKGASLVAGKHPDELDSGKNLFYTPTVVSDVTHDMKCCQEETFGPLLPLIRFETDAQALEMANDTQFGLASYVFGRDKERAHKLIGKLHFGHCGYNTGTGPAAHAPFGGFLHSGIGREGGVEGLMEFVESQTVPDGS
ncbi:NAD-dependent succinate-semialdehyde dehydrogenase [Salinisphaera sp. Q1T1-3]|uniref:NAD-dependent succinate-semialdehyde dehydrogenase n=1 Tax=Salinisphaera sp. Q1T1-3 TaxID=2321229 RepID=UPI000E75CA19|nr:NAD-dependent succinate-semialdehyde dehydrogenase [Salinisphaera sp. Q1T1-3]RJS93744.1 NAD-dependent succinate-semialdehyde dehydrogenase [Salinisphaera sp. Q1T1-3]